MATTLSTIGNVTFDALPRGMYAGGGSLGIQFGLDRVGGLYAGAGVGALYRGKGMSSSSDAWEDRVGRRTRRGK